MKCEGKSSEIYRGSHMLILVSYSLLAIALIGESFLMDWEKWPLLLIAASVIICWFLHIRRTFTDTQRMWAYTLMMMSAFFFYGMHPTSMYDMSLLMLLALAILTTTGERKLIWVALFTYYVTMAINIVYLLGSGAEWDALTTSRTLLHICIIFMAGWMAQTIIRQWAELSRQSEDQIHDLNETTKRVDSFMANLSQELLAPIGTIKGAAKSLVDRHDDEETRAAVKKILVAEHKMEMQAQEILDYSELAAGTLTIDKKPCSLSSIINGLVDEVRPLAPPELELIIDVSPSVPASLQTDANMLKKILYHLIANSIKYTNEGGIYVRITSVHREYGLNLFIELSDTGIGMTQEEIRNIFYLFYQADSKRNMRSGGLGIGMGLVHGFVSALGGFLTVDSTIDDGTIVTVSLPMEIADESACMEVDSTARLAVGGYFDFRMIPNPHVHVYCNSVIKNLTQGLGIPIHRIDNTDDLRKLVNSIQLTHLFVGEKQYRDNVSLMEALSAQMVVAVIAQSSISLSPASGVVLLSKPFSCFPVVGILNMTAQEAHPITDEMLQPVVPASILGEPNSETQEDMSADELPDQLASIGVNMETGLLYCQNDEEFYRELLSQYASEAPEKISDLDRFLDTNDSSRYAIAVHSLKSTSKMLGAQVLSDLASLLEKAAKEENEEYLRAHHEEMTSAYRTTTNAIDSIVNAKSIVPMQEDGAFELRSEEERG